MGNRELERLLEISLVGASEHTLAIFEAQRMDAQEVEALLRRRTLVALATVRSSGTPHIAATDLIYWRGRFFLGQSLRAVSLRNLRRRPRVSLFMGQGWRRHLLLEGMARELVEDDPRVEEVRAEEKRRLGIRSGVIVEVELSRLFAWKSPKTLEEQERSEAPR